MILKKPYGLLIKHFRLIHIIMAFLLVYLGIKTAGILKFFSDYASSGTFQYDSNLAGSYIDFFMYGAVILIIGINITIYLLMKSKDKQTKLYTATIIYYVILFILFTIVYGIFQTLQIEIIDTQVIRVYRDISLIVYLPQFFFIFYSVFRGIGFDIKKFNFNKDLEELAIEEKDSEEVEITVGVETYKLERTVRRFIREFTYYIQENTFIFICIVSVIVIILGTTIFYNRNVYNRTYKRSQTFTYQTFKMKRMESYLTNLDYNGIEIAEGKYYLVVNFDVENIGYQNTLSKKDFRLMIKKDIVYPTQSKNEYFVDLGDPYQNELIRRNDKSAYALIFELDEKQIAGSYRLRIVDKISYKIGEITPKYKDIIITPEKVNKITDSGTSEFGKPITFENSSIDGTKLTINDYQITDNYLYNYEYCFEGTCNPSTASVIPENSANAGKTLLVLNYNLDLKDSYFKKNSLNYRTLFVHFVRVKYSIGNENKILDFKDKTPNNLKDVVVMQLNKEIKNAENIDLIITVRDNKYIYKLK